MTVTWRTTSRSRSPAIEAQQVSRTTDERRAAHRWRNASSSSWGRRPRLPQLRHTYRDDDSVGVVAFTAEQIPGIEGRTYPPALRACQSPLARPGLDGRARAPARQPQEDPRVPASKPPKLRGSRRAPSASLPGNRPRTRRWGASQTVARSRSRPSPLRSVRTIASQRPPQQRCWASLTSQQRVGASGVSPRNVLLVEAPQHAIH